jgi:hypothetical protein
VRTRFSAVALVATTVSSCPASHDMSVNMTLISSHASANAKRAIISSLSEMLLLQKKFRETALNFFCSEQKKFYASSKKKVCTSSKKKFHASSKKKVCTSSKKKF